MSASTHIYTAPTAPTPADATWGAWSKAWTRQVKTLTGRTDLTVTVAPGAGRGAPACYLPKLAAIEVDARLIGDPTTTDPRRAGHKADVPSAYGALVHEAAHAVHSLWTTPAATPPVVAEVAKMLEEARAEHRHRGRRPRDRKWLRHAVREIVSPGVAPTDDPWHAAWAAGLLLARRDTRILTHADVRALRTTVTRILGHRTLGKLRTIWRAAHTTADDDHTSMIDLARRWCEVLGIDPDTQPDIPATPGDARPGNVAAGITATHRSIDPHHTPDPNTPDPNQPQHGRGTGSDDPKPPLPAGWVRRPPRDSERHAASRLAAQLRQARTRDPVTTREQTAVPPGRLRVRHAITAAAQRSAGTVPTAAPWQRTVRRPTLAPELALGVLVDASASMRDFAAPMSSAAWILARAATRIGAITTTVTFGSRVTVVVPPGKAPAHVTELQANEDATRHFDEAVHHTDRLLGLTTPGQARLLTVVSDGLIANPDQVQRIITRLLATGCGILWLTPPGRTRTYRGPTTVTVTNPTDCINLITRAAATALTHN